MQSIMPSVSRILVTLRDYQPPLLRHLWALSTVLLAQLAAQEPPPKPTQHPFLWRIEGRVPSYLFGTFHLPDPRVTTLHPAVEQALANCDALFTEVPMDYKPTAKEAAQLLLPPDKQLSDVLPRDV